MPEENEKPISRGGRVAATLFFGVFLGMGLLFTGLTVYAALKTVRSYSWTKTICAIEHSSVDRDGSSDNPYVPKVRYSYSPGSGQRLSSQTISPSSSSYTDYDSAWSVIKKYPPGSKAECFYNPESPQEVALQRNTPWMVLIVLFPLIFVAVGAGGIYGVWSKATPKQNRSLSGKRISKVSPAVVRVIGTVLFIAGAALAYAFVPKAIKAVASQGWTEQQCEVIDSTVLSHRSDDSTTFSIDIFYKYTAGGKEYRSSRYAFLAAGSSSGYHGKREVIDRYPRGARVTCFVNPDNPAEAVLVPGPGLYGLLLLIPFFFILGGIGLFRAGGKSTAAAPALPPAGPQVLAPYGTRKGNFIGLLLGSIICSGLVFVLFYFLLEEAGALFWLPAIFIGGIFGLLSVVFIVGTVMQFISLFNPSFELQLSGSTIRLGDHSAVTWRMIGSSSRLTRLRIVVEGTELVTYHSGDSTKTDTATFFRVAVADVQNSLGFQAGTAKISIPENTMHSFKSGNTEIRWSIRIEGEMKGTVDINDVYLVTVVAGG